MNTDELKVSEAKDTVQEAGLMPPLQKPEDATAVAEGAAEPQEASSESAVDAVGATAVGESAEAVPEMPGAASADAEDVEYFTDYDAKTATVPAAKTQLAATATPSGEVRVSIPVAGGEGYVSEADAQRMAEEAYLRGRNEAVRMQILADSSTVAGAAVRGDLADDVSALFAPRPSVWDGFDEQ